MTHPEMLTKIDKSQLADAFPASVRTDALEAARLVSTRLHKRQWSDRVSLHVGGELIQIPRRLRFNDTQEGPRIKSRIRQMVACLSSQSGNGFDRQRALKTLLQEVQPWSAPFVVALIGEYVLEIIEDILAALTAQNVHHLVSFVAENPEYWNVTKQRVASYWNAYYRNKYTKLSYPGFELVKHLEAELRSRARQSTENGVHRSE